jgi:hypothetical protein
VLRSYRIGRDDGMLLCIADIIREQADYGTGFIGSPDFVDIFEVDRQVLACISL